MTTPPDVFNLTLAAIAVLAAGYLGYRLGRSSEDEGRGAVDVIIRGCQQPSAPPANAIPVQPPSGFGSEKPIHKA
jgi:hypothetical protein